MTSKLKKILILSVVAVGLFPAMTVFGASNPVHYLKAGLSEEPKTLNIWLASDRWSLSVLSQIYQGLMTRHPETLELTPWLAENLPVYDPETLSYTVTLRNAKWSDGSPLTAQDVAFTANLIKEFKIPRHFDRWSFVKAVEVLDAKTVRFFLEKPMAIFLSRTLATPIVSKKEWEPVAQNARNAEKPLTALLNHEIKTPIGNGPFSIKEWKEGAYLFMTRNPYFFGSGQKIGGRVLGPFIGGIIFKFFGTSDAAILSLKKGDIDMFWWSVQAGYIEDLQEDPEITLFKNERSAMYYMGFNLRKPPFDDAVLRRAVAILIDKDFIITRILQGDGARMDSVVPAGNKFYYCPPDTAREEGLSRDERIKAAYRLLKEAGYSWKTPPVNDAGAVVKCGHIQLPDGTPMEGFTILTPPADYDPLRAMSGTIIQEWLRDFGMPASAKPMAFGSLIDQVKVRREFDAFILAYGKLSLDPDWIRSFFHSRHDKVRGRNMSGYHNPEFDRIADESATVMDENQRRKLVCRMQKILMRDLPYLPLYTPKMIEAVRNDRFSGWVNTLEGIGNPWSFCVLKPQTP